MEKKKKKGKKTTGAHDHTCKFFLSDVDIAVGILKNCLPIHIAKEMDFSTMKLANTSFVDSKLNQYFSDIIYEVQFRRSPVLVDLLFDHKSKEEKFMGMQFLKYKVRIWEYYLKQNKHTSYLPPIIPIVIYHGKTKWRVDPQFKSLFYDTNGIEEFLPDFKFIVYDIPRIPERNIKGDIETMVFLKMFRNVFNPEVQTERIPEILGLLNRIQDKTRMTELLETILRFLLSSVPNLKIDNLKQIVSGTIEKGEIIMETIAEHLIRKGAEQAELKLIRRALHSGLSVETISKIFNMSIKHIEKLRARMRPKAAAAVL